MQRYRKDLRSWTLKLFLSTLQAAHLRPWVSTICYSIFMNFGAVFAYPLGKVYMHTLVLGHTLARLCSRPITLSTPRREHLVSRHGQCWFSCCHCCLLAFCRAGKTDIFLVATPRVDEARFFTPIVSICRLSVCFYTPVCIHTRWTHFRRFQSILEPSPVNFMQFIKQYAYCIRLSYFWFTKQI